MSALGISLDALEIQFENFRKKFPPIRLNAAATVDNGGIVRVPEPERQSLAASFDEKRKNLSVLKFVPASGDA